MALDIKASSATLKILELAVADESQKRHADADARIAAVLDERGDAIDGLKATLRRHPDSLALRLGLARAYEEARWHDQAATEYQEVLVRDPTRIVALAGLGNVERIRDHHADAVKLFNQAIDRAVDLPAGQGRDAVPSYRRNRARELILLADEHYDGGRFVPASGHYEKALDDLASIDPHRKDGKVDRTLLLFREHFSAVALLGLGRSALAAGQPARAIEVLHRALDHAIEACKIRQNESELKAKIKAELDKALGAAGPGDIALAP